MAELTAHNEAQIFFELASRPGASVDDIRRDIQPSRLTGSAMFLHRTRVLYFFNAFMAAGRVMKASEFPREPKPPLPPKPVRIPKFDDAAIVEAIKAGARNTDIARIFGCCRAHGSRIARRFGIRRGKGKQLSQRTKLIILAIKSGEPRREISLRFQVGRAHLCYIAHRYKERANV